MKNIIIWILALCSIHGFGQTGDQGDIFIDKVQNDDTYRAGEKVIVNATIDGDMVMAGGQLIVNDSINGDMTAAGGELLLNNYIADDLRIAVGRVTIDSEIGDDLVVFAGEVILTERAKIHGDLKCFAGYIEIKGEVSGRLDIKGASVFIDGTIRETSKIVAEDLLLGSNAKFYKEVQYWTDNGEMNFNNALVNTEATLNEELAEDKSQLSLTTFGTRSAALWLFYILSAFLVILVLHALFRNTFADAVVGLEQKVLKSFGFGLIYLVGIPLLIILALLIIIGIPLGIFITVVFIFSLLFGHLVAALLLAYYLKNRMEKNWGFWSITFIALLCAIVLRLFTMIPFAGIVLSAIILSITYGALTLKVLEAKKQSIIN